MMQPVDQAAQSPRFSEREKKIIFGGLMLGILLAALDQTIVATALPAMARDLSDVAHMSWVVSAYLLTATAVTPIYGKLSDLYGRKRMLQVAIGWFLAASILCALAGSMGQLVAFRALQGMGGGGLMAMAHATIADIIAPRERGRYQGYFSSVFAAASVAGPVLGGFFAQHLTWRWVFWINLPIGLLALIICDVALRRLPAKGVRRRIDYAGAILLMASVGQLLLVTTWGGTAYPWGSPVIIALTLSGLVLLAAFIYQEMHTPEAILPPRLFRNAVFSVSNTITFLTAMVMFAAIIYLPLFLQLATGASAEESGFLLIPLTAGIVCGAFTTGRLVSVTGRYKIFPLIGMSMVAAVLLLFSRLAVNADRVYAEGLMTLLCMGFGGVLPSMVVAVQNSLEMKDLGSGTSSVTFFRSMGGSFGVALVGAVLLSALDRGARAADTGGLLGPNPGLTLMRGETGAIATMNQAGRAALSQVIAHAFVLGFLVTALIACLAVLAVVFLKEVPLRSDNAHGQDEVRRLAREAAELVE